MAEFAHLHVHTQYSTLDGALRVKDLAKRTAALGMKAVAITDHANMFGAIQLHKYAKEFGVSPILGCELNVARPRTGRGTGAPPVDHLVVLAASEQGYKNLVRLVSCGHTHPAVEGVPSVTLEAFEGKTAGLVGLTGCLGGLVQQRILDEGEAAGEAALGRLKEIFEPGHLFVEVQEHGLPEQPVVGGILSTLAARLELPLVGTNVVHFKERADGEAQLLLQCIQTGRSLKDAKEGHHGSFEMFLKSPDEMAEALKDYPGAAENTLRVAEMCTGWKLKLGTPMLPNFPVPEGMSLDDYFRKEAREGLERRFAEFEAVGKKVDREAYKKRLETEADIIVKMKFPGYFLIVWDFIRYGKENGVPVGPGRGSGAGSLVAYALRITDLDPIPYDLLFERFLNPERVSMPDFDVDFCMDKRDRVIQYVAQKYGKDSVGQIATFHELKARSVIKDVARAMQFEPVESQRIAGMIPIKGAGQTYTIPEVLKDNIEPKLTALMQTDARVKELIEQAQRLEGLTRHAGMHAAGVVISEGPLWDHVPVFVNGPTSPEGPGEGAALVTQYYKDDVELAGLVKFDFLGLKTLTVIDVCVPLVRGRPDQRGAERPFDLDTIPLDDKDTYALLQSGETTGVFQLESSGMQQLFRDLKPDCFEDIVAAVALYRPGPLETGMVKDFVECKHGRQPIKKMHPLIDEVLKPTYGVIVYQEQVMQIAQRLAGYTLGGADLLRRAMGKKKPEEMAKQKGTFVDGAGQNGVPAEEASAIFDLVEKFAGYGFNKSHSAAYALITYQTAYLKAHYPVEFLCALMTADKEKNEKVVRIIAEARAWGMRVLPPDVNESDTDFKVVYASPKGDFSPPRSMKVKDKYQPQIRFGLGAVRGIGEAALVSVFEARASGGPFSSLFDFAARVDAKKLNRGVLEALVQGGAFDRSLNESGVTRSRAFAAIDLALERARSASRDRESGQTSLLDLFAASAPKGATSDATTFPPAEPWDLRETLVREKQSLGFYVSGHPLDRYGRDMGRFEVRPTTDLPGMDDWAAVKIAGMVEGYREKVFKGGGGKVAFFELEDTVGRVKVKVRDRQIQEYSHVLTAGEPVLLSGKLSFPQQSEDEGEGDSGPRDPTLFLNEVRPLAEAIRAETRGVTLRLKEGRFKPDLFAQLRRVLEGSPGPCPVDLVLELESEARAHLLLPELRVEPSDAMLAGLERLFGEKVAELR
ncbi:MAG TPA: DNA polymerase III subunit alpha [Polyangiaceae bacterium]|nr:DNA polymerase III subunit alpha [Polyangiaceae bacterium]